MADKTLPTRPVSRERSRDQSAISEDITRIVGYLNTKRSDANERTSDLVQEITQRREDILGRLTGRLEPSPQPPSEAIVESEPIEPRTPRRGNPLLAERYHAFCRDLDALLDSFRARVEGEKRVRH